MILVEGVSNLCEIVPMISSVFEFVGLCKPVNDYICLHRFSDVIHMRSNLCQCYKYVPCTAKRFVVKGSLTAALSDNNEINILRV